MSSDRLLRGLCWALFVFVILSAIFTVALSQGLLVTRTPYADGADLPTRLAVIRADDSTNLTLYWIANFATLAVFVIALMLAAVLRRFAPAGPSADVMATVLAAGSIVGIVSQVVLIGTNQAASFGYCDCGFKTEELIAQDYALNIAFTVQSWLNIAAIVLVGVGAALAGAVIEISSAWRWLSYGIAAILLVAVLLQIADMPDTATLLTGLASIAVAVWAVMLARGARSPGPSMESVATA